MTMPTFFVPLSVVRFVYLSNPNPYPNSALNVSVSVSIFFPLFSLFSFFVIVIVFLSSFLHCLYLF